MQLHSLHNIMVTHNQILKSISHSEPLCPLAETVVSLFAPNKQLVIISLAIKLNHIPGKGNVAVVFFFFFPLKWERRVHFWKSRHTITTVNMTITPLWQEKFMFCLIKTVLISQSPVTSTLVIWNLNICVQIVLVTRSSYVRICLWWCLFPPGTPQGEFWLVVEHRAWELVILS